MTHDQAKLRLAQMHKMAFLPALGAGIAAAAPWVLKNIGGAMLTNFVADKALGAITGGPEKPATPEAAPAPAPVAPARPAPRMGAPRRQPIPWAKMSSARSPDAYVAGFTNCCSDLGLDRADGLAMLELLKAIESGRVVKRAAGPNWQPYQANSQNGWGWNGEDGSGEEGTPKPAYTPGFFDTLDDKVFGGSSTGAGAKPQGLFSRLSDSIFGAPKQPAGGGGSNDADPNSANYTPVYGQDMINQYDKDRGSRRALNTGRNAAYGHIGSDVLEGDMHAWLARNNTDMSQLSEQQRNYVISNLIARRGNSGVDPFIAQKQLQDKFKVVPPQGAAAPAQSKPGVVMSTLPGTSAAMSAGAQQAGQSIPGAAPMGNVGQAPAVAAAAKPTVPPAAAGGAPAPAAAPAAPPVPAPPQAGDVPSWANAPKPVAPAFNPPPPAPKPPSTT